VRVCRGIVGLAALLAIGAGSVAARERYERPEPPRHDPYAADALAPVRVGMPESVELLREPDAPDWPSLLGAELAQTVRSEWPVDRVYGAVFANLGVTLRWPLVTAESGGSVIVPVVDGVELPIEGALSLARSEGPRRVVVLVDASASANATTAFGAERTPAERVSVLEAERRALEHLIELSADDWLELGVIAFGESTWPVAEPGLPAAELRNALARFRVEHPRGEGRTDAVCALWTARDWLESTPAGVAREIVVLTDGDVPFSGRFLDCEGEGRSLSDEAEAACEARRNPTTCPASHRFSRADGSSDMVQMGGFARRVHGELTVHPLLFETDRTARPWQQVARGTGGRLVRVPGPEAIELALPALVSSRIRGVVARNTTTGAERADLLQADRSRIAGALALVPGANEIELEVQSDRGTAALFRFRVYSAPAQLERWLAELRERNLELEARAQDLDETAREKLARARERKLDVVPEAIPAAPVPSP
jgi:hypothetical protein